LQNPDHVAEFSKFELVKSEAKEFVGGLVPDQFPDAFYIDPMYPPRNSSALPKKDIQILRQLLVGDLKEDPVVRETNLRSLIELCLQKTKKRVVLKRPIWLEPIIEPKVSFEGKLVRYDVYVRE
jgi:16S rRNA (guanine1516-N2)-methyltransferase